MRTFALVSLALAALVATAAAAVGGNQCTWGPTHWCSSLAVAKECGTVEYCKEKGFFLEKYQKPEEKKLVGGNHCTWGPTHWCSKASIAKECGTFEYCKSKGYFQDTAEQKQIWKTDCSFGPLYWCGSVKSAEECGALEYCQKKGFLRENDSNSISLLELELLGLESHCQYDRSIWCSSPDIAQECGVYESCQEQGFFE